jgi:hypothetical protein
VGARSEPGDLDPLRGDTFETFLSRLAETIEWCAEGGRRQRAESTWYGPELSPPQNSDSRKRLVAEVALERRKLLATPPTGPATSLAGGRLLAFFPDATLRDGAARVATGGLFDDDNRPVRDTWVCYIFEGSGLGYLVCWMPPTMLEDAASAIDVNPEECIFFLDDFTNPLVERLVQEGMLAERARPGWSEQTYRGAGGRYRPPPEDGPGR